MVLVRKYWIIKTQLNMDHIINSDIGPYSNSHYKMLDAKDLFQILV